jgi:hypothetical protein
VFWIGVAVVVVTPSLSARLLSFFIIKGIKPSVAIAIFLSNLVNCSCFCACACDVVAVDIMDYGNGFVLVVLDVDVDVFIVVVAIFSCFSLIKSNVIYSFFKTVYFLVYYHKLICL